MRKKLIAMSILVVVLGIALLGCVKENHSVTEKEGPKNEYQFDAKVLEVQEEYLLVKALDGQVVVGEVKVWTGLLEKDAIPALEVGDTVRITNDGKMTMSIPAQMTAVEITKISK